MRDLTYPANINIAITFSGKNKAVAHYILCIENISEQAP
ncbi:hypothetical protein Q7O_003385 [Pectobacterium carotovorum subsp. carotovorum PCCS1]|nr:hypothetical protein [Pectobacterium carotovorum subsp. carotovorum PCCS1]